MNHPLPDMMSGTMGKIREMIGANAIVGDPITTPEGVTIIPVSKVSFGFAGGGSDFMPKSGASGDVPFGGGTGAGVNITPIAFLVCRGENVRLLPIAAPANGTLDRLVEQAPELIDKVMAIVEEKKKAFQEKKAAQDAAAE